MFVGVCSSRANFKEKPEVEVTFNVIGPSGTFFIIEAETDNRNVLENTLRKYFNKVERS